MYDFCIFINKVFFFLCGTTIFIKKYIYILFLYLIQTHIFLKFNHTFLSSKLTKLHMFKSYSYKFETVLTQTILGLGLGHS